MHAALLARLPLRDRLLYCDALRERDKQRAPTLHDGHHLYVPVGTPCDVKVLDDHLRIRILLQRARRQDRVTRQTPRLKDRRNVGRRQTTEQGC